MNPIHETQKQCLIETARDARLRAYAPYSKYLVGAALLTDDGKIFGGCNVENASYGLCMCAERVAVGSAVAAAAGKIVALAVVTADGGSPCGACRQVLAEMNPLMIVIIASAAEGTAPRVTTAADLLPGMFVLQPKA